MNIKQFENNNLRFWFYPDRIRSDVSVLLSVLKNCDGCIMEHKIPYKQDIDSLIKLSYNTIEDLISMLSAYGVDIDKEFEKIKGGKK